jgi:ADP-ribose pyrophosphatase YjhB (NUDIX family)
LPLREFPAHPLVGVGGIVFDSRGHVLLVKRGNEPRKGHWSIPGGLLELGESLVEGVKREIAEETGLIVQPQAIVEVVERIYREEKKEDGQQHERVRYHYILVDYWCTVLAGEARPASDAADLRWANPAEWREANPFELEPIALQVIEKAWQMAFSGGFPA